MRPPGIGSNIILSDTHNKASFSKLSKIASQIITHTEYVDSSTINNNLLQYTSNRNTISLSAWKRPCNEQLRITYILEPNSPIHHPL